MPVVIVEMWEGRNTDQKKKLVEGITKTMTDIGIPADAVTVVIKENSKQNWGQAGKLASEGTKWEGK